MASKYRTKYSGIIKSLQERITRLERVLGEARSQLEGAELLDEAERKASSQLDAFAALAQAPAGKAGK